MRYHHTYITGTLALTSAVPVAGGDMKLFDLMWCWRKGEAVPCVGCGRTQCVHTCPQNPLISEQFHRQDFRAAHLFTYRQRPKSFLLMSMGALVIVLFQDLAVFLAFPSLTGLEQPRQEPKAPSMATLHSPLPVISNIPTPPPHSLDWILVLQICHLPLYLLSVGTLTLFLKKLHLMYLSWLYHTPTRDSARQEGEQLTIS